MTAHKKTFRQSLREVFMPKTVAHEKKIAEEKAVRETAEREKRSAKVRKEMKEQEDAWLMAVNERFFGLSVEIPNVLKTPAVNDALKGGEISTRNSAWDIGYEEGRSPVNSTHIVPADADRGARVLFQFMGAGYTPWSTPEIFKKCAGATALHHAAKELNMRIDLDTIVRDIDDTGRDGPGPVFCVVITPDQPYTQSLEAALYAGLADNRPHTGNFCKPLGYAVSGVPLPKIKKKSALDYKT